MKLSALIEQRLERLKIVCATMKLSRRTEKSYAGWVRRFILANAVLTEQMPPEERVRLFLESGAEHWSASTQSQALNALVFHYRHVLERPLGQIGKWALAKRPKRLPTWLPHEEMLSLIGHLRGVPRLMAEVAYGSGARNLELVQLRIKDIDLSAHTITVRGGKGNKDRVTLLPKCAVEPLQRHIEEMRALWMMDRRRQRPGVQTPSEKYDGEAWPWFWVFAANQESRDPSSGLQRRHHLHESTLGKALEIAIKRRGSSQRVTVHSLRHSFATTLLQRGATIYEVKMLLGHKDIRTTEIYLHCLPNLASRLQSPLDAEPSKVVHFHSSHFAPIAVHA